MSQAENPTTHLVYLEERQAELPGDGAGQHGLATARRPVQEDAAWGTHAQVRIQRGELCGVEDQLADLLQDAVDARQVRQARLGPGR